MEGQKGEHCLIWMWLAIVFEYYDIFLNKLLIHITQHHSSQTIARTDRKLVCNADFKIYSYEVSICISNNIQWHLWTYTGFQDETKDRKSVV